MSRTLTLLFALLCASMLPTAAKASACTSDAPGGQPWVWTYSGFTTVAFNPDSVAPGNTIASQTRTATSAGGGSFNCTASSTLEFKGTTAAAPGAYSAYPTNVPGIGVRITMGSCSAVTGRVWPYTQTVNGAVYMTPSCQYIVELIKTGTITSGGTLSGEFAGIFADGTEVISIRFSNDVVIAPTIPTCAPTVADKIVNLGQATAQDFATVGSTAGTVSFNIDLVCSGGVPTTRTTNLYVTLTDSTNPANISDTLELAPGSTASGVGVQILKSGTPIGYGPASSAVGNTNQWFVATTANGNLSIPLTARYVRTGTVNAGQADALATFTFSYQ